MNRHALRNFLWTLTVSTQPELKHAVMHSHLVRSLFRRRPSSSTGPCPEVAHGGHERVPQLARRRLDDLLEAVVLVAVHLQRGDVDERPLRVHHDL